MLSCSGADIARTFPKSTAPLPSEAERTVVGGRIDVTMAVNDSMANAAEHRSTTSLALGGSALCLHRMVLQTKRTG
jgi:hypothetical protein